MLQLVEIARGPSLDDYAAQVHLAPLVADLRAEGRRLAGQLGGRTIWMVSSTATGGGVAEMLPRVVAMLCELGVHTRWVVIGSDEQRFFTATKQIHNLIHGAGVPRLDATDRAVYEAVSLANEQMLAEHVRPGDVVIAHDPQPAGAVSLLKRRYPIRAIWRSHIGLDRENDATREAWGFLHPWLTEYDRVVFSVESYVPEPLRRCARIIPPAIDPLSHKNRELPVHKLTGVLTSASLLAPTHPQLTDRFETAAQRLQDEGGFAPAMYPEDPGLLFRPIVTQVSRFDRLKGFLPLLRGFVRLKEMVRKQRTNLTRRHGRRLEIARLVLAGSDPRGVRDDPEGQEVLDELTAACLGLDPEIRRDVVLLVLPMVSRKENALMVNAIQRCSSVVVQNSLQEGFGLTAAEAMWKSCPILGTQAVGLRAQIRPGVDGGLIDDPEDADEIATKLNFMLAAPKTRTTWGENARRRVAEEYLVFRQVHRWLCLVSQLC